MLILSQLGLIWLMFRGGVEFGFWGLKAGAYRNSDIRAAVARLMELFAAGYIPGYGSRPYFCQAQSVCRCLFVSAGQQVVQYVSR